jgi:hypothetical protein
VQGFQACVTTSAKITLLEILVLANSLMYSEESLISYFFRKVSDILEHPSSHNLFPVFPPITHPHHTTAQDQIDLGYNDRALFQYPPQMGSSDQGSLFVFPPPPHWRIPNGLDFTTSHHFLFQVLLC